MIQELTQLYGEAVAGSLYEKIEVLLKECDTQNSKKLELNEHSSILIAYPDHIKGSDEKPLRVLQDFINLNFSDTFQILHILPFYPSTGDFGFEVSDYWKVFDEYGSWEDIASFKIVMADFILNHVSYQHPWFQGFLNLDDMFDDFVIVCNPSIDLSNIPKSQDHDLLTRYRRANGEIVHVWTKYNPTQIDLNYKNPELLYSILKVLAFYSEKGIKFFRLDAIAFMWKDLTTSCANLPEVVLILKILRNFVEKLNENIKLVAEIDVMKYHELYIDGGNNKAHLGYNYDFCPIILHACISGSTTKLKKHLKKINQYDLGPHLINFLSSHDGIFLKPYDPPLSKKEIGSMSAHAKERGGSTFYQTLAHGDEVPYEINISVFDYLCDQTPYGYQTLLLAFFIQLSIPGVPALYMNLLLGGGNDYVQLQKTQDRRSINRKKFRINELEVGTFGQDNHQKYLLELKKLLALRKQLDAFSPSAKMSIYEYGENIFSIERIGTRSVLAFANFGSSNFRIELDESYRDLISKKVHFNTLDLASRNYAWLIRI